MQLGIEPASARLDQRYYGVGTGRFGTPDPSSGANAASPWNWNKYLYVGGDPVNFKDRHGLNRAEEDEEEDEGYPDQPFIPSPGGGGEGGGGGDGHDSAHDQAFWKAATTMWKALDVAMAKLDSEKCRGMFGNGTGPDARAVLHDLAWGGSQYGNVIVNDIADKSGQVTSATTKVSGLKSVDIGFGATQLVPGTVLITINDLAGNFVNGNVNESAATLLHELGHAYSMLGALGGSPIKDDGDDVKLSEANQALIKKNCF